MSTISGGLVHSFVRGEVSFRGGLSYHGGFRVTAREKKETLSSLENVLIKLNEEQRQI